MSEKKNKPKEQKIKFLERHITEGKSHTLWTLTIGPAYAEGWEREEIPTRIEWKDLEITGLDKCPHCGWLLADKWKLQRPVFNHFQHAEVIECLCCGHEEWRDLKIKNYEKEVAKKAQLSREAKWKQLSPEVRAFLLDKLSDKK